MLAGSSDALSMAILGATRYAVVGLEAGPAE
jgi:hypothetical protein